MAENHQSDKLSSPVSASLRPQSHSRPHIPMASVTTSLALGAKQTVRGVNVAGKRTAAPKAVNTTAKAQISKGARPPSFGRRFDAAKTSISCLPALPAPLLLSPASNARRR